MSVVRTLEQFEQWLQRELSTKSVTYFRGDLAEFRHDAGDRIAWLQTIIDRKNFRSKRTATEAASVASEETEVNDLQKTLDLCRLVLRKAEQGAVLLTQRRLGPGDYEYIATRVTRRFTND